MGTGAHQVRPGSAMVLPLFPSPLSTPQLVSFLSEGVEEVIGVDEGQRDSCLNLGAD